MRETAAAVASCTVQSTTSSATFQISLKLHNAPCEMAYLPLSVSCSSSLWVPAAVLCRHECPHTGGIRAHQTKPLKAATHTSNRGILVQASYSFQNQQTSFRCWNGWKISRRNRQQLLLLHLFTKFLDHRMCLLFTIISQGDSILVQSDFALKLPCPAFEVWKVMRK